ncbi:MAG: tRNA guanosine(34) transglycosylase Tgt [Patescibacteria group bacterium]|nr:tRNA guanosine(34) transglycosylase Tgt [Patescibacteria group bacterium]
MKNFSFKLVKNDHEARLGLISTPHGKIETPVFMPVGTLGSVKTASPDEVAELGAQIILANNYHLYLRPGVDIIAKAGGIHRFISWERPILTDSGGFQVFSLGRGNKNDRSLVKINEKGVEFRSHLDGSTHRFTPENVIRMQEKIGADIIMCLDECAPHDSDYNYARDAMERTHNWAIKCLTEHKKNERKSDQGLYQAIFGIIQGVIYDDLRIQSARFISEQDFDGIAIGGLSVGESKDEMHHILESIEPLLPKDKPRYLMGVGSPEDLLAGVERGIDMFDCVLATRIARNGTVWTRKGKLNLNNAAFSADFQPIEKKCCCYACQNFSRAYVAHLLRGREILGIRLTTLHNLHFIMRLMDEIRESIREDRFTDYKKDFLHDFLK